METAPQQAAAPSVIRIKRKRDDAPLDSLYLQDTKRRATDHTYVFKRLEQEQEREPAIRQEFQADGIPKIRTTPKGEEKRDPYALGKAKERAATSHDKIATNQPASATPRQFHLSQLMPTGRKTRDVATFVERRKVAQNIALRSRQLEATQQRSFKRPSSRSRLHQDGLASSTSTSPTRIAPVVAEKLDQWSQKASEEDSQKRSDLQDTARQPDAMEIDDADYVYDTYYRQTVTGEDAPREGISFGHLVIDKEQEELWESYLDGNESDDKEFETDDEDSNGVFTFSQYSNTFEPMIIDASEAAYFMGLIKRTTADLFGRGIIRIDQMLTEDYYGADYPEDEVASDDEFNRDAYQFRRNADDLEEFDVRENYIEEDDTFVHSGDEEEVQNQLSAARAWKREFGPARKDHLMMDA